MNVLAHRSDRDERAYVYAIVRRILRNDDAANDATQDALLLAHRHRDQFRGDSALRTWLYRIAVTTALGVLRKASRSREQLVAGDEPLGWALPDDGPSPEQEVAARQLAARAAEEVAALGERYRTVFALKADEWAEREIADELAISLANVKIRAHRVRQHLRGALGDGEPSASPRSAEPAPRTDRRQYATGATGAPRAARPTRAPRPTGSPRLAAPARAERAAARAS